MPETVRIVALALPPILLCVAVVWVIRDGRNLSRPRRRLFAAGLLASSVAYASRFVLFPFLATAHLSYFDRVDLTIGIGGLMFLAAAAGFIASCFGRGYGRITALLASLTVAASWWFTKITA